MPKHLQTYKLTYLLLIKNKKFNYLFRIPLGFLSRKYEEYNFLFSSYEIECALSSCGDSFPGLDNIPYQMLKQLAKSRKFKLLFIYNQIWSESVYPLQWKESSVVLISKPGKDKCNPSSYLSISLTSCVSKLLEHIANERLSCFFESNDLF